MFSKGTDSKIKGISDKKWYDIVILMAMWQQVCHVDFLTCVNSEEYIFDFLHCLGFPFVLYSWGMNLNFKNCRPVNPACLVLNNCAHLIELANA